MKKLLSFVLIGLAFTSTASADTLTLNGSLSNSNAIQLFDLSFPSGSTGSIEALTVGFDPVLSLFAPDGTTLLSQDDDSGPERNALISGTLPIGNYILALTQFDFFPDTINDTYIDNLFTGADWSVVFIGANDAVISIRNGGGVSEVPVPAAAWLFGSALIGFAGLRRKSF